MVDIVERIIPLDTDQMKKNKLFKRRGVKITPCTLTVHSTANLNSTADGERDWLTNPTNNRSASWHYCVDDKKVVVAVPCDEEAYHCGNSLGNSTSLSLEICESGDREKTLQNAIDFIVYVFKARGWGIDKLRRHCDWAMKDCPRILNINGGKPWKEFVAKIDARLKGTDTARKTIVWKDFVFDVIEESAKHKVLQFKSWGSNVIMTKVLREFADVKTIMGKQPVESIDDVYKRTKTKILINGGLFAMNNGNTMGVVKTKDGKFGDNGFYYDGYCFTVKGRDMKFVQLKNFNELDGYDYAVEVAPSLIKDGQISVDTKGLDKDFIAGRHPRQAIGMDDTFFYTLTVDGRTESNCGLTIEQLACLCKDLEWKFAGNLDGGGSIDIVVDGKHYNQYDTSRKVDNFIGVNIL